jgi:hypothetical protein
MRPPRTEQTREPDERAPLASRAAEPPLADRLRRALDRDDVVSVVGLLSLADDRVIGALPPDLLDRLRASTAREIAAACDAKRSPTPRRPARH